MTHNQHQMYMGALYRLASNDSINLDLRYAIARDMQRARRERQAVVSRETLFRLQRATRKAVGER